MNAPVEVGTFLRVWDARGATVRLLPEEESRLDAAVSHYLETNRDTLLSLTTFDAGEFKTRASDCMSWMLSTPESRERSVVVEMALRAEEKANGWVTE